MPEGFLASEVRTRLSGVERGKEEEGVVGLGWGCGWVSRRVSFNEKQPE